MEGSMQEATVAVPSPQGLRNRSERSDDLRARARTDGLAAAIAGVRVSVVIPTLNEAANLPHVFAELPGWLHEVVLVDGFSSDGTVEVARRLRPDVRIVLQERRGKGDAVACGFAAATGDIIVMLDADGSADP